MRIVRGRVMPKLTIGAGIAKGAQAFVQSFQQAKQYENQEKMQKNSIILQALFSQLQDDNIPYAKRAAIIDSIPGLIGAKINIPLSQQFGLHDMLDDDVTIEEGKPAINAKEGTSASTITDSNAIKEGLAGTISQQATQSTEEVSAIAAKTLKFGDMSPARYKQLIKEQQDTADTQRELEKAQRIAEINFDLQERSWKAQGYTKEVARGVDSKTGRYRVLLANSDGDVKPIDMPEGFIPLEVAVAQAKGQSSAMPAPVRVYKAAFETKINPVTGVNYTPEEAQEAAVNLYKQYAEASMGLKALEGQERLIGARQKNTGTQPEQPHEAATRQDAAQSRQIAREQIYATMESQALEAEGNITGLQAKVGSQEELVKGLEYGFSDDANDEAITKNYSKGDPEYTAAENELNRQKRALADMKADLAGAQSKATALRQRANSYKASIGDATTSGLTPEQQAKVNIMKANPKNTKLLEGKSDLQIWSWIQAHENNKNK